jgi:transcriptional regulator with XRE-family HTH domain
VRQTKRKAPIQADGPGYRPDPIRRAMFDRGLTNESLAATSGVLPKTVSAIRNGHAVKLESLKKVAKALGVSMAELCDEEVAA